MGLVCRLLAGEGRGNLQTYCPQFRGNQTLCRSHRLYSWDLAEHLRFVILEHWTDLSGAGWLLQLIFRMSSQLIWFYRERLVGGALYWKICSVVYALDFLYSCACVYVWGYYSKKCISYNTGKDALLDIYARCPRAHNSIIKFLWWNFDENCRKVSVFIQR